MDIFDKARRALGDLAQSASAQAQIIQLQARMGEIESELTRQYAEAGRRARELWRQRLFADPDFEILMTRITNLQQELERLRIETTAAAPPQPPAPRVCAQCGTELSPNDRFCGGCGATAPAGASEAPPPPS
jgi:hypothetical protein